MNKNDIAKYMSNKTNLKKAECLRAINALTELIKEGVRCGESVNIKEFGSFTAKYRKEKLVFNLATRKPVLISARKVPTFKPTLSFKQAVNN